ncbi:MAG: 5'/3'-nucleotidase SurE [Hyphomicrobiales bacterium]|nr:5'/3'-nucleotidase SurE [Hyphomicrobiales bacterium]
MRILLTNDDGIHAPGLETLERVARQLSDDVTIVAPAIDQSGVSHSFSLNDPLRLRQISPRHFAVKGTPTDCVIMAVKHLMKDNPPDLILSGINSGQNVAEDVTYSGTIAGAIEGTILGIPSIALSQAYGPAGRDKIRWDCAEALAPALIRKLTSRGFPHEVLFNLNFPDCAPGEVAGVQMCAQGRRDTNLLRVEERRDGRQLPYYWLAFARPTYSPGPGTDLATLAAQKVAITPLRINLTDDATLTQFATLFD